MDSAESHHGFLPLMPFDRRGSAQRNLASSELRVSDFGMQVSRSRQGKQEWVYFKTALLGVEGDL